MGAAASTAGLSLLGLLPGAASAAVSELGATRTPLEAYMCPSSLAAAKCTIILTKVTALTTARDGISYPTTVRKPGRIVAFSVGLSRLSPNRRTAQSALRRLDALYGGTPRVAITVLKPVGRKSQRRFAVAAQGPVIHVMPYLGQVVQFPLPQSLTVVPGEVIALSTPTWAPVLAILQPSKRFAYRQSRTANCDNPPNISQAQLTIGQRATYKCDYPGTRVEYSATEITDPVATRHYIR